MVIMDLIGRIINALLGLLSEFLLGYFLDLVGCPIEEEEDCVVCCVVEEE